MSHHKLTRSVGAMLSLLSLLIFNTIQASEDLAPIQKAVSEVIIHESEQKLKELFLVAGTGVPDPGGNGDGPKMRYEAAIKQHQKFLASIEAKDHKFLEVVGLSEAKTDVNNDLERIDASEQSITSYQDMIKKNPDSADYLGKMIAKFQADVALKPQVLAWKAILDSAN